MFSDSCLFNSSQCWNRAFDVQDGSLCEGSGGELCMLGHGAGGPEADTDIKPAFQTPLETTLFSRVKVMGTCVWFWKASMSGYSKAP